MKRTPLKSERNRSSDCSSDGSLGGTESGYNSVDSSSPQTTNLTSCPLSSPSSEPSDKTMSRDKELHQGKLEDQDYCADKVLMMAGWNLVCIPAPIRNVSSVQLLDLRLESRYFDKSCQNQNEEGEFIAIVAFIFVISEESNDILEIHDHFSSWKKDYSD